MGDPRAALSAADLARWRDAALAMVGEVSRDVLAAFRAGPAAEQKADGSLVTAADRAAERRLREEIARRWPDHGMVGEEWPDEGAHREFVWIMDPIDGTEEFVNGVPLFGSILGLYFRDQPVVGLIDHPALDLKLVASYGAGAFLNGARVTRRPPSAPTPRLVLSARANFVRMSAGDLFDRLVTAYPNHRVYRSCFAHTCAAIGSVDVAMEYGNRVWDFAATRIVVEEAGGAYVQTEEARTRDGTYLGAAFGDPALVRALAALAESSPRAEITRD